MRIKTKTDKNLKPKDTKKGISLKIEKLLKTAKSIKDRKSVKII